MTSLRIIFVHDVLDYWPRRARAKAGTSSRERADDDQHTYRCMNSVHRGLIKAGVATDQVAEGSRSRQCASANPRCFDHKQVVTPSLATVGLPLTRLWRYHASCNDLNGTGNSHWSVAGGAKNLLHVGDEDHVFMEQRDLAANNLCS